MDKSEWLGRAGDSWAAEWRRTDRSFGTLTDRLLAVTRQFAFVRVLDVGCGAGELSLAMARGRPAAMVMGVDLSPALIDAARQRADRLANVEFVAADAARWAPAGDFAPDLLMSRHGVMFFEDPVAAFTHLSGIAAPGAGLLFSCFRGVDENPFFTEVMRLLPEPPPPVEADAPSPFAFADRDRVIPILRMGGWEEIRFEPFDFPMVAGAGEDPVEDAVAYFSRIGPAARALSEMDGPARDRFLQRVRELAGRNCQEGVVSLPAAAWIVSAPAPS